MNILPEIAWEFNKTNYDTISEFNKAISQYQLDISKDQTFWNPEEIVISNPFVEIFYTHWVYGAWEDTKDDTVFDNEKVISVFGAEEDDDETDEERNICVKFTADNGKCFTALELMYKLHQRLAHRDLGDHIFFEGLTFSDNKEEKQLFKYFLYCGS